ncbi:HAD hydrolase-like protein [Peribacillus frigoritolerans]|uniref:HAD hydrolase-like protein n=1 Tax=Peribacillus frigoritolerans TaxID=450367 RepID=UPI001059C5D5|nr:HAD hydrolase-like protein [Peribacillus frigoritolerans]TDL78778.1 HAD family hydrolase [Peribacillus frigoritolerans]
MNSFKLAMFDLDGTLTDPGTGIIHSIKYALNAMNVKMPSAAVLKDFIGPPLQVSFQKHLDFDHADTEQAIRFYREYFTEKGMYENEVYPGIISLLEDLQRENITLAVATSKPTIFAEKILKHFKMDAYFEHIAGSNLDGSLVSKSDIIAEVVKHYPDISKLDIIMIGDRKHDMIGAKENNIASIGVLYGYGSKKELSSASPEFLAQSVSALKKTLMQQGNTQLNQTFV